MAYCILRMAKLKSRVSLLHAAQHNTRERQPANADPERTPLNPPGRETAAILADYDKKKPAKVRKNAVHALEFVVTMSPDAWNYLPQETREKTCDDYIRASLEWVTNKFGGKDNLLSIRTHYDETTPHAHILLMPLVDGKLNARAMIGGTKDRMRQLQGEFYQDVGAKFGLERGRPKEVTNARHLPIGQYYAIGQEAVKKELERREELTPEPKLPPLLTDSKGKVLVKNPDQKRKGWEWS